MFWIVISIFGTNIHVIPCENCQTLQECSIEARTFTEAPREMGGLNYCVVGDRPEEERLNAWEQRQYDEWQSSMLGDQ